MKIPILSWCFRRETLSEARHAPTRRRRQAWAVISTAVTLLAGCLPSCRQEPTSFPVALLNNLRIGYENYLREGGKPLSGEIDTRDFRLLLEGGNEMHITFLELFKSSVDAAGYVIDMWGTRITITALPDSGGRRLELRSAGSDRVFGTRDDIVTLTQDKP